AFICLSISDDKKSSKNFILNSLRQTPIRLGNQTLNYGGLFTMSLKNPFLIVFLGCLVTPLWSESLPPGCTYNKECRVELPGSVCGDGSPSYFTLVAKENSPNLLVYLEPGGACWSAETCQFGHVLNLSAKPKSKKILSEKGLLNLSDPTNPFFNFSKVSIPYCTGDVFLGDRDTNYGDSSNPKVIHHRGFKNALLTMQAAKEFFPDPERVVLFGRSAGGLGVLAQVRNLESVFPRSIKYALADSGTPLMPPYVDQQSYQQIIDNWNAHETLPAVSSSESMNHFGDLLRFNILHFPLIRYGLIQSYEDVVMTYFAKSIGAPDPSEAVAQSIISASDHYMGLETSHAKVFFVEGRTHVLTKKPVSKIKSAGMVLSQWLDLMFSDKPWPNVRPDLEEN
ncbi:MAG: pectin acetylesterase-family hydrolase, partial [Pseudomonadota bacterium]